MQFYYILQKILTHLLLSVFRYTVLIIKISFVSLLLAVCVYYLSMFVALFEPRQTIFIQASAC